MKIKEMLEKKIKEKQKKQRVKIVKKVTAGTMAGIVAGIVGGVLMAPKSLQKTINDIVKTENDPAEIEITKTVEIKEILDNKVVETKIKQSWQNNK